MRYIIPAVILVLVAACIAPAANADWQNLEPGMELCRFKADRFTSCGDSMITVLRIDPALWDLKMLMKDELNLARGYSAREWCQKYDLVAAINAGMFDIDYSKHIGYMQSETHINNPRLHSRYKSVVAFGPVAEDLPEFRIFDLDEVSFDFIKAHYSNLLQNDRLIKRPGENRWPERPRQWSEAALGEDDQGRILFIFSRSPYSMHEFNNILLSLPINIACAQHLEGGPEAQLYIKTDNAELELVGSYETSFQENDNNSLGWRIPNVIGVSRKEPGLLSFFDDVFEKFYPDYKEMHSEEYIQLCNEYGLDKRNEENQHAFYEINFYHDLLTGNGASDCVRGGILEIPYFWHWTDPNPRHEILALPDSNSLASLKAPKEFSRYKSHADIDRVPSIFLSDLVAETPKYSHPDCGDFYTFGWCSEREMSFCLLLTGRGYQCKIKQEGIHTRSEVLITMEANNKKQFLISALVDNTFDYIRWVPVDSSANQKEWLTDYGSGSNIAWYNENFNSDEQKRNVRDIKVSLKARDRIEKQISSALR